MSELSIDIETLGNNQSGVVQQIGWAVIITNKEGVFSVARSGNIFIDIDSALSCGMTVNHSCLKWWFQQSHDAQQKLMSEGVPIKEALLKFNEVVGLCRHSRIWSSAPSFDYAMVQNAYALTGVKSCWDRKKMMCLRTLRKVTPWIKRVVPTVEGVRHVAEYDAIIQGLEAAERYASIQEKCT